MDALHCSGRSQAIVVVHLSHSLDGAPQLATDHRYRVGERVDVTAHSSILLVGSPPLVVDMCATRIEP
jgi:hypothetical protein